MRNLQRPVKAKEIALFAGAYFCFVVLYHFTLWIYLGATNRWFDFKEFLNWGGIDHLLKLLLGVPIWWLIFRKMWNFALYQRLLMHVITLPLFVFCWQHLYYPVMEKLEMYHHIGTKQIWDVYISTLFYMLQFGLLHAYGYFRDNQENIKRQAVLHQSILQSELSALKAQLNPHFLYNVFNTINASIPAELEQTRQMIAELSDLFRYQLRVSKTETVSLREELAFTAKYLDLEKARFEERLTVEIVADATLLDEPVPPLILQPIVENAVKHGISTQIAGGKITISVMKKDGHLSFSITDTGPGVADKSQLLNKGIGLTNTELRLNKMFGTSLIFTDHEPQGLCVQFSLA
jgi:two-component system LytT family sensor kinase